MNILVCDVCGKQSEPMDTGKLGSSVPGWIKPTITLTYSQSFTKDLCPECAKKWGYSEGLSKKTAEETFMSSLIELINENSETE